MWKSSVWVNHFLNLNHTKREQWNYFPETIQVVPFIHKKNGNISFVLYLMVKSHSILDCKRKKQQLTDKKTLGSTMTTTASFHNRTVPHYLVFFPPKDPARNAICEESKRKQSNSCESERKSNNRFVFYQTHLFIFFYQQVFTDSNYKCIFLSQNG